MGDGFEVDAQAKGARDLDHGGEAGVAVGGQSLVEALAGHPGPAGDLAQVARPSDRAQGQGDHRGVVIALVDDGLKIGGDILDDVQVVGRIEPGEGLCAHGLLLGPGATRERSLARS